MRAPRSFASLELAGTTEAPQQARAAVRDWLDELGVAGELAADLVLVVSELVTNAVIHARSDVVLEASAVDGSIQIVVEDRDGAPPALRDDAGATGGFGLRIVERLTDAWGSTATPTGKRVWAERRY